MTRQTHHEVIVVGAGFSGIGAAIKLKRDGIDDLVILEQRDDIGGVWYANTYPGVAVDITSFTYSFGFEPNPRWSRVFARGHELKSYADHCVDRYDLRRHLRLRTEVSSATWDEHEQRWHLRCGDGTVMTSRFVIMAMGGLTRARKPDIPGLDRFEGSVMHTAQWDHTVDLTDRRVGVIGTGASALQLIPEIAPIVEHLDVYQRTPIWVFPKPDLPLGRRVHGLFERIPAIQRALRLITDGATEVGMVAAVVHNRQLPALVRAGEAVSRLHLRAQVRDRVLREKLRPAYGLGCKRPSFSNTYWKSLTRPNVELRTAGIEEITATGIRTRDGHKQHLDALVLATGFSVLEKGSLPAFPVHGIGGDELGEFWNRHRYQAFEGTSVPGFPNMWMVLAPYAFTGGSWFGMIDYQTTHALRVINEIRRRDATSATVSRRANDRFFDQVQRRQRNTVFFNNNCATSNSYYFDEHGDAPFVRPSTTWEANWRAKRFDLDVYDFTTATTAARA